jgi:hypothetical protein
MRTPRPRPLSLEEQSQRHEDRFAAEAESAVRRTERLLDDGADEDARIRALQAKLGLTPFKDHADAKPLLAVVDVLNKNLQRIRDELTLISISRLLSGEMGFAGVSMPTGARLKEFEARRDALQAKLAIGAPEPVQPKPGELPASIREALTVFDSDEPVKFTPTRMARQTELQAKQEIVETGLRDAAEMVRALRDEIGDGQNRLVQKAHGALHVQLFRACQAVAEAAEQERSVRAAMAAAGYTARSDILLSPSSVLSALLLLGSELDYGSQISQFRRVLQSRGLLK